MKSSRNLAVTSANTLARQTIASAYIVSDNNPMSELQWKKVILFTR